MDKVDEMITTDAASVEAALAVWRTSGVVVEQAFRFLRHTNFQAFDVVWKQLVSGGAPKLAHDIDDAGRIVGCRILMIDKGTGAERLVAEFPVQPVPLSSPSYGKSLDDCIADYKRYGGLK
jgi:hypothetical protein